jgi:predicted transcriptional regulator
MPAGKLSVNRLLSAMALELGLLMVRVRVAFVPDAIEDGEKALLTVGAASTVRVAEAVGPAVGTWKVVTPETVLT